MNIFKQARPSAVRRAALVLVVIFTPLLTRAVVVGPYTADASTVFLFHLNEPSASTTTTNALGTLAAGTNAVTFHQAGNTTAASPLDPTIFTGSAGAGGFAFGNSINQQNNIKAMKTRPLQILTQPLCPPRLSESKAT